MAPKKDIIHKTRGLFNRTTNKIKELRGRLQALRQERDAELDACLLEAEELAHREPQQIVHLSTWSLVRGALGIIGVLVMAWVLYSLHNLLILLFVALLLAAALDPLVDAWERKRIPRSLSVFVCYVVGLVVLSVVVSLLVPMMVSQIGKFTIGITNTIRDILLNGVQDLSIPFLTQEMEDMALLQINKFIAELDLQGVLFNVQEYSAVITNQLSGIAGNFWGFLTATFNGLFNALLVLVIAFFILVDKRSIRDFSYSLLPRKHVLYVTEKTAAVQQKIGAWLRGQLILCAALGFATYIGFWTLALFGIDIPYKETLAVITAVTAIIPVVGAILGMLPAVLLAMNISFIAAIWVVLLYFIVQQIEGNILLPVVMNHAVGLNPVVIIVAMLIGAQFFGLLGVVLAIPVTTSLAIFVKDYANRPNK